MNNFFAPKEASSGASQVHRVPWVEKYRPKTVDAVVFQHEVVAVFKKVLEGSTMPNMLLYGPPGTGKTSAAVAFCRQLFPDPELYRDRVLELNASDERGIQVVRTRIKDFAQRAVSKTGVPLKIVILDEADAMTSSAQSAMRRIIEMYCRTTRFFLICNYISRIIDPLTSRCAKFRFKPLPLESQMERMLFICEKEGVKIEHSALESLIILCEGDLRRSITYLQSVSCRENISGDFVANITGQIDDKDVRHLLLACRSPDMERCLLALDKVHRAGHAGRLLIAQMFDILLDEDHFTDLVKAIIYEKMAVRCCN
ncbi:unnamed protein product [Heligmosomoides polygyrus]|uniref:AAA domain-containing protein n=1 Tax=Heligmosomoides polygyrus TaxID=6339 RepID=A0A183FYN2_HELPZ|nr:unnamed protein product [Heligmosomoides polygyrus]